MSTKQIIVSFSLLLLIAALFCFLSRKDGAQVETKPEGLGSFGPQSIKLKTQNYLSADGSNAGGLSTGPGIQIHWAGVGSSGNAEPLGILKLTAGRLSHLQSTPQASDKNARALIEVLEAIDALEETNEVSAPVGPGFIPPGEKR